MYQKPSYQEMSAMAGMLFVTFGVALWATNFVLSVFTSWMWAMAIGGVWVAFGTLLLYPDVRLYQGDQSVSEQYLTAD